MNVKDGLALQSYRAALLELKLVLDHVYCFNRGALGLPLTEATKRCLTEVSSRPVDKNLPILRFTNSKTKPNTYPRFTPKLTTTPINMQKSISNSPEASRVLDLRDEIRQKDDRIQTLEGKIEEQRNDIADLEEELRETQRQMFQLRESGRQRRLKKYAEASEMVGIKRNSSLLRRSVRHGQKTDFPRRDSLYIRQTSIRHPTTENPIPSINEIDLEVQNAIKQNVLKRNANDLPFSQNEASGSISNFQLADDNRHSDAQGNASGFEKKQNTSESADQTSFFSRLLERNKNELEDDGASPLPEAAGEQDKSPIPVPQSDPNGIATGYYKKYSEPQLTNAVIENSQELHRLSKSATSVSADSNFSITSDNYTNKKDEHSIKSSKSKSGLMTRFSKFKLR
ncbi:hypothetical protein BB560_005166 [Smittium megazygosporum]|uniref:Uncharacterized protein n=1 Tax=Smittium megazygosporum TaxID=133381 RepID=A0A2T9Z787_9FUNG|nr:hypothetical protein BB560_005166 [Smittium megazygosporum]